ncbi:UNVERIFIED_CONTAM: hypothetical protein Sradi_3164600 [Sesamum radiatum]|uniref:Uncharacterized protein n=1 Tax=Sesamum radiatum TaxID=300843 RepID=A0AAW2REK4_SESRA
MYQRKDDDYYNPIDLNHIFHDNDILEEWTREAEEPLLPENDLDWLDEEGRMDNVQNDEDDDASLPLSHWSVQQSSKGKDDDDDGDGDCDDDNDGDNDGGGNVHKNTQQSHGMTWAEGDENYYATQERNHGYRPRIENQRRFLYNLTDYPSQDDDSQSQRYSRRQPDIQHSMQNLGIDEHRPHQLHGHQGSSTESSHSSGSGTYSQGFDYYNQNMEHVMPHQPQVPYEFPSQPVLYILYGIPSHSVGVINVGSYTPPYTQNTSHDYYRRIDGDDHFEPHRHSTFF